MKRMLPFFLALCLLLSLTACGAEPTPTTVPTTVPPTTEAPTEPPTTVPPAEPPTTAPATEPAVLNRNPLTGEAMDAPYDGRIFAVTINNVSQALPHYGVPEADMYFDMLVNGGAIRGLALYTDPSEVGAIGSVRSARPPFIDICQAYDAILVYSGGSDYVLNKLYNSGIAHITEGYSAFFRDYGRYNGGYAWEHCLFVDGSLLDEAAQASGYRLNQDPEKAYKLQFVDAVDLDGEAATEIEFNYWSNNVDMIYDAETGRYEYYLFGDPSYDGASYDVESFQNVILLWVDIYQDGEYHVSDTLGSGEGYYACNGEIIPILWERESEWDAFTYTMEDGTPLELNVGNTYVGFVPNDGDCDISWE